MQDYIGNLLYDTEKATLILTVQSHADLKYNYYRTNSGNCFYVKVETNIPSIIQPTTQDTIISLLVKQNKLKKVEEIFGPLQEA